MAASRWVIKCLRFLHMEEQLLREQEEKAIWELLIPESRARVTSQRSDPNTCCCGANSDPWGDAGWDLQRSPQGDLGLSKSRGELLQVDQLCWQEELFHPADCLIKQGCVTADLFCACSLSIGGSQDKTALFLAFNLLAYSCSMLELKYTPWSKWMSWNK